MKKFPRTKARSRLGVAFVERVVFEAGSIFRSIPEETDLGIDGYIEFVENEVAAGTLVGVQIKTGCSYLRNFTDGQYFQVDVSRRDLNYWHIQPIPIALIAFDPESNLSGWLDVTGYIRNNTDALQREHTSLTVNCRSSFDVSTFVTEFKSTFENYRSEGNLFSLADLVVSADSDKKLRGLIGLLQHNTSRFSRLTCLLLLQHLFYPNDRLRATVADALSRYLPHPEVGFIPPPHIRDYVEDEIGKYGRQQIAELLDIAWLDEENLMERGSLGQCVGVIVTHIPEYKYHLCQISTDPSRPDKIRIAAIALAGGFGMYDVLSYIAANLDQVSWGDAYEAAKWAAEACADTDISESSLEEIVEHKGYDSDEIGFVLHDAGLYFLIRQEHLINQISNSTANSYVWLETSRALTRIMNWRYPPANYMDPLF